MIRRTAIVLLLLVVAAPIAGAQTVADFHAKYGKTVDVYSVSEHIWMTPEYAADGQVCRLRLYPKRIDAKANYGTAKLPFDELRDVLNDLVPVETRGTKQPGFGLTDGGGGVGLTRYEYENVHIIFSFFFRIDPKALQQSQFVDLDSDIGPTFEEAKNLAPDKDDFVKSESTEIVIVSWPARKCVKE